MDDATSIQQLRAEVQQARGEIDTLRAEAERRDHALAEALEQQGAVAEILHAIGESHANPGGVLDAIVRHATALCHGPKSKTVVPSFVRTSSVPSAGEA